MELPTKRVVVKASGHECLINVTDFNPEIHEAAEAKKSTKAAESEGAEGEKPAADKGKAKKSTKAAE